MRRSQIASAWVGSPIRSCEPLTGTWLVMRVEARSAKASPSPDLPMPVGPVRSRLRRWAIQAQVAREWTRALSSPRRGCASRCPRARPGPAEVGLAQAAPELALLALGPLGVHEHAEAVLEAEQGELGIAELSA